MKKVMYKSNGRESIAYGYGEDMRDLAKNLLDAELWGEDWGKAEPILRRGAEGDENWFSRLRDDVEEAFFCDDMEDDCFQWCMEELGDIYDDTLEDEHIGYDIERSRFFLRPYGKRFVIYDYRLGDINTDIMDENTTEAKAIEKAQYYWSILLPSEREGRRIDVAYVEVDEDIVDPREIGYNPVWSSEEEQ